MLGTRLGGGLAPSSGRSRAFPGRFPGSALAGPLGTATAPLNGAGVAEGFDDAKHFCPGKEQFVVLLLVILDRLQEIEFFLIHRACHGVPPD